jgi:hypothetical protein
VNTLRRSGSSGRTIRVALPSRPSAGERAREAMRALRAEGRVRIPGDGAAFSRVHRILEQQFALERAAFHAGDVDHVHRYTLRRNLYADEWVIARELVPAVSDEVREAYRARLADRVADILDELRTYDVAGFRDTRERSPIDGHWFDSETLELLEIEARRAGLRYRVNACQGLAFAWIDLLPYA